MNCSIIRLGCLCLHKLFANSSPFSHHAFPRICQSEFTERRLKFVHQIGNFAAADKSLTSSRHLAIIPAAELQYRSLHVPFCFHQDSYFRYLTGLVEPNAVLTIEVSAINSGVAADASNLAFIPRLFVEERNDHEKLWDGPSLGVDKASELTGISEVLPLKELSEYLSSVFSQLTNVNSDFIWFGLPFLIRRQEKAPLNRTMFNQVSQLFTDAALDQKQLRDPFPLLDELRVIKSPGEILLLKRAVEITSTALKRVMHSAFPGILEAELANRMEYESRLMGCRLGYPAVVAGGPRANIIHYLKNDDSVEDGQLVLMDVGSEVEGYTADISRTWPINGHFTKEQRLLHEILVSVQRDCRLAVSLESSLQQVYDIMLSKMAKYLAEEGILREQEAMQAVALVCPHHVGHHLGLDVHDAVSISYSRRFLPNMVFPLEPGIYFPLDHSRQFHVSQEFRGLGLRLEDDYVVSDNGTAESLGNDLSSEANMLENYVKGTELCTNSSSV